jgi:hypothetical protein
LLFFFNEISEERKELLKEKAAVESQRKMLDSLQQEMSLVTSNKIIAT